MQDSFSQKERQLAVLQQEYVSSVVAVGKLTAHQSDWLVNEMTQKGEATRKIFIAALSRRLAAVRDRSANQKRLVESEV